MDTDSVFVRLVPEKKGLILKHSEYEITSKKYKVTVVRRYNDFVTFHGLLLTRFPYRMLPRLPPKQIMLDSLLEERRRGLQRWLLIIYQHPIITAAPFLETFLTDQSTDHIEHLRGVFSKELDEYSKLTDSTDLPVEDQGRLASSREMMRFMLNSTLRIKRLMEQQAGRVNNQGIDLNDMSAILKSSFHITNKIFGDKVFQDMVVGLDDIATISVRSAAVQSSIILEKIYLILDILTAHSDLCDRVEKGIVSEHQKALSKMININRQKIKGVIRGSGAENVAALHEQEVAQTGLVGNLERRSAFSLQCVLQETTLAQKYLQVLPAILLSFSYEQQKLCSESYDAWAKIILKETS